ncbi:MAG: PAQR family membrane homeostasis protein TrhA [Ilumatobacteraceae bacterium]
MSSVVTASRQLFGRPSWRGRMHTWTFVAAVPAGLMLIAVADGSTARAAAAIYAATLVLVFGTSAAYHRLTRTERARAIMQRVDHSMIYLLIAGTYTPLCLVALPPRWGLPILCIVGMLAVIGVVFKLVAFDRMGRITYALYPAMGWMAIVAAPALLHHLSPAELLLILAGGLAYTAGLPVLLVRRPDPWPTLFGYHEVWHVMTIVAAALHFAAVYNLLDV